MFSSLIIQEGQKEGGVSKISNVRRFSSKPSPADTQMMPETNENPFKLMSNFE